MEDMQRGQALAAATAQGARVPARMLGKRWRRACVAVTCLCTIFVATACHPSRTTAPLEGGDLRVERTDASLEPKGDAVSEGARPATCIAAAAYVMEQMDQEFQAKVRATPRNQLIVFHDTWGMAIRNDLGLWGSNRALLNSCANSRPCVSPEPDDVSLVIIELVWERLQARDRGSRDASAEFSRGPSMPRSCDEMVSYLLESLKPDVVARLRAAPKGELDRRFHDNLGAGIRSGLELWSDNGCLLRTCAAVRPGTPPEVAAVSALLIELIWERLHSNDGG